MKVTVKIEPDLDACTITHESVHLKSSEDVAEWRKQLMNGMDAQIGNARVYLLIDYFGFSVSSLLADEYGVVAEELRQRYAIDVFRYGESEPQAFLSARLQSLKRAHRSNVFATRQQAIDALNKVRSRR